MNKTIKNFFLQTVYQILIMVTPLITAPYVSRVLGPENIGINSYSNAITNYFIIVAALGIENYGSRTIAACRDNKEEVNKKFTEIFLTHFVVSIIVAILFLLFCFGVVKENREIFLIQGFFILGVVFDINWLFFGVEDFKSVVPKNCIIKILSVISILVLVKSEEDLFMYSFILSFSSFLNYAVMWINLRKHVKWVKVNIIESFSHFKPLCVLFLPVIAITLYKCIDKIMLGNMSGQISVGYYTSGEKIINLCLGIITALGTVMLPKITYLVNKGDAKATESCFENSIIFMGIVAVGMGGGLYNIADIFVPFFFGEGYEPSIIVIQFLAFSIPFSAIANIVKTQYLLPNRKDKSFTITLMIGAIINFLLNYILIPVMDVGGATLGTLCTEILVCILQVMYSNKSLKTWKKLLFFIELMPGVAIMSGLMGIVPSMRLSYIEIGTKIIVGGLSYLVYVLVLLVITKRLGLLKNLIKGK